MATRRSFVPENPACNSLEARLAPSNTGWLNHTLKDIGNFFTPHHHSNNAAAGIAQLWKDSAKSAHAAPAHHPKAY